MKGQPQVPTEATAPPAGMPPAGMPPAGMPGMAAGGPRPMGAAGVGAPPIPMRGDGPNMPNYALAQLRLLPKLRCPAVSDSVFTSSVAVYWPVLSVSTGAAWLASSVT